MTYECFPYDDPGGLIDTASTTLNAGAEPDKPTIGNDPERIAVGNSRGLGLLERLAMLERRLGGYNTEIGGLKTEIGGLKTTITGHGAKISRLEKGVANLKEATANYHMHRERFLSVSRETFCAMRSIRISP